MASPWGVQRAMVDPHARVNEPKLLENEPKLLENEPKLLENQPELLAIWIKIVHRGPMRPVTEANLIAGAGLEGSVHRGGWRQVTLLDAGRWREVCASLGQDVDPVVRRANLLVRGLDLEQSRGRTLEIGATRLSIGGETAPCRLMDDAVAGLQEAMRPHWGGGAFARVLVGGPIRVGDRIRWAAP